MAQPNSVKHPLCQAILPIILESTDSGVTALELINKHKVDASLGWISGAARLLVRAKKIGVIRGRNGIYHYLPATFVPENAKGLRKSPKNRHTRSNGTPETLSPGKHDGAFALLEIAGKLIEFTSLDELGRFVDSLRSMHA